MNELLPENIKIVSLTSTNPTETAFATYCYPDNVVDKRHLGFCLGDVFSVNWIEDTVQSDPNKETLKMQYERVKDLTEGQKVSLYGDKSFMNETLSVFFGHKESDGYSMNILNNYFMPEHNHHKNHLTPQISAFTKMRHSNTINSRDVKLNFLFSQLMILRHRQTHREKDRIHRLSLEL